MVARIEPVAQLRTIPGNCAVRNLLSSSGLTSEKATFTTGQTAPDAYAVRDGQSVLKTLGADTTASADRFRFVNRVTALREEQPSVRIATRSSRLPRFVLLKEPGGFVSAHR